MLVLIWKAIGKISPNARRKHQVLRPSRNVCHARYRNSVNPDRGRGWSADQGLAVTVLAATGAIGIDGTVSTGAMGDRTCTGSRLARAGPPSVNTMGDWNRIGSRTRRVRRLQVKAMYEATMAVSTTPMMPGQRLAHGQLASKRPWNRSSLASRPNQLIVVRPIAATAASKALPMIDEQNSPKASACRQ